MTLRRRQFLQTVGVAGVALALAPKAAFGMAAQSNQWRNCVMGLVDNVFEDYGTAAAIKHRLSLATLQYAPASIDFHSYFSAPLVFVEAIPQRVARCGNGFEVSGFPLYSLELPCMSCNDLNSAEINRITNAKEIEYYQCVVSPVGERRRWVDRLDHAEFKQTIDNYPYDADEFEVAYVRRYRSSKGTCPGYYITSKRQTGATGKPLGDMILGELNPERG